MRTPSIAPSLADVTLPLSAALCACAPTVSDNAAARLIPVMSPNFRNRMLVSLSPAMNSVSNLPRDFPAGRIFDVFVGGRKTRQQGTVMHDSSHLRRQLRVRPLA